MASVDLTVCGALKSVSLGEGGQCSDKWLEYTVSGLPLLEKLSLACCFDLDKFEIRSESLKSFCFVNVEDNADLPGVEDLLFPKDMWKICIPPLHGSFALVCTFCKDS
ncbi:hypothetical protein FNV43_RR25411 [Rhamnella rubrinervis]|uniref:Uncharacterized protein n=1 Tax=Rhamnella rubrinervis TaxID=2594499 RepID=A0A8K0GRK9_9ROSA|nr:hypothetical protein FNV43_RR25411 [Rhamnella rubrinervis]